MKKYFNIKSSSIVESIIASVIIVIVFSLAILVYVNILSKSTNTGILKLRSKVDEMIHNSICQSDINNDNYLVDGFEIQKKCNLLNEKYYEIQFSVFDSKKKIIYLRKLIVEKK